MGNNGNAGNASLKRKKLSIRTITAVILVLALVVFGLWIAYDKIIKIYYDSKEIINATTLERIIDIDELSTFTAVYNGIAEVADAENADKDIDEEVEDNIESATNEDEIKYYVAYEARVNAGIDVKKADIDVNHDNKIIYLYLPAIYITDATVDISSLDYIFFDKKEDASGVTQKAYAACEKDVWNEIEDDDAIFDLAKQNAENIMKALIEPFVEQMDGKYTLEIEWEERTK